MPNRIIREGIIESLAVNTLSWAAEVFYRRLLNKVDDFGRTEANIKLLRAALYPLKLDKVSDRDTQGWLQETEQAGLVKVYEVESKRFLEVQKFRQQVRAKCSKYPAPPSPRTADAQHMPSTRTAHAQHMHTKTEAKTEAETNSKAIFKGAAFINGESSLGATPLPPPEDAQQVQHYMAALPNCTLRREELEAAAESFFNESEAVGWTLRGQPVRDWRATARAYLAKWQLHTHHPKPATPCKSIRQGCNNPNDYR